MEIVAIAAVAENGVIGDDGELPWESIPADKRQYRARVRESPVVLGRRTYESMRDDLPGTSQIVLTSRPERLEQTRSSVPVQSVWAAISRGETLGSNRLFVLGGGSIYEAFWPHINQLYLSRIPGDYRGDTRFPALEPEQWDLVDAEPMAGFTLEHWKRMNPPERKRAS